MNMRDLVQMITSQSTHKGKLNHKKRKYIVSQRGARKNKPNVEVKSTPSVQSYNEKKREKRRDMWQFLFTSKYNL